MFLVLSPRYIQVDMTPSQLSVSLAGTSHLECVPGGVLIAIVGMMCAKTCYKHQHPTSPCVSIALPAKTITVYTG